MYRAIDHTLLVSGGMICGFSAAKILRKACFAYFYMFNVNYRVRGISRGVPDLCYRCERT